MKYGVYWSDPAFDAMQELIHLHPDRLAYFGYALRTLAQLLAESANTLGESRDRTERVVFVNPLVISFDIDEEDEIVEILWIRMSRKVL